mgnify:CR=1 FL=1
MSLESLSQKIEEIFGSPFMQEHMQRLEQAQEAKNEPPLTPAQAAVFGSYMIPGSSLPDMAGKGLQMPSGEQDKFSDIIPAFTKGERTPSYKQNVQEGNYVDATLQLAGLAGDATAAIAPPIAAILKAPRAIQKAAQAGRQIKPIITTEELLNIRQVNVAADRPRLQFKGPDSKPRDIQVADRVSTSGKYRGGPRGLESPQALSAMRRKLEKYLKDGENYKDWYKDTNNWAKMMSGDRAGLEDLYAATAAITSQGTSVSANAPMAIKGFNQGLMGDKVWTGRFPTNQSRAIEKIFTGVGDDLGPKRQPFFEALAQVDNRVRQTNDIRQARAFGYKHPDGSDWSGGLSEAQHRFMDRETGNLVDYANKNKLAGSDNWDKDQVQAAIWVAQKAEDDSSTLARAGGMFSDYTPEAIIRTEAMPSKSLGHLSGLGENPDMLDIFSATQDDILMNPQGQSVIASEVGALMPPQYSGAGLYTTRGEDAVSPGIGQPIAVGKLIPKDTKKEFIDPSSQTLVEGIGAAEGLIRAQDTVGYTFITKAEKAADRDAIKINLGRTITSEELLEITKVLRKTYGKKTAEGNVRDMLFAVHSKNGFEIASAGDEELAILKKWKDPKNKNAKENPIAWQGNTKKLLKDVFGKNIKSIEFGKNQGKLVGDTYDWTFTPSRYLPEIERLPPEMQGRIDAAFKKVAPQLEELDARLVDQFPNAGERQEMVTLVRTTLATKGIKGLRDLVDRGVVPAVALAILGPAALNQSDQSERTL